jgi:hypothetical protein
MDPLIASVQYTILKSVGKHVVLPIFLKNIDDIATKIYTLKNQNGENAKLLKTEIEESDLEHKIMTISSFLKERSEDEYESRTVHMHLCGICDVLEKIQNELCIMSEDETYKASSWGYTILGEWWYKDKVNFPNLKRYIKLLDNRYNGLLDVLKVHHNNVKQNAKNTICKENQQ